MSAYQGNEPQGQDTPVVPGQEQPVVTPTPGPVTTETLTAMLDAFDKKMDEKLNKAFRGAQSQTDKLRTSVQSRLDAWEKAAQGAGIQLSTEQRQALEAQAFAQELSGTAGGQAPGLGQPTGEPDDAVAERVNNAAEAMMKVWGVQIYENDPEDKLLQEAGNKSPQEYLEAVQTAIKSKAARLKGQPPATQPVGNPAARTPGVVGGAPIANPIQDITDPDQLWQLVKDSGRIR